MMQGKTHGTVDERIRGCLIGGAAGDALGYAVEFMSRDAIIRKYGGHGITAYSIDRLSGKALISDDTQMTLFTAEGILEPEGDMVQNIYQAYRNWLLTQKVTFESRPDRPSSVLMQRPELFSRRAPGNTCLSALMSGTMGDVDAPVNSSKGCGGVMRVAPIAFLRGYTPFDLDELAAAAAAITHGHPLGWLPAALLVHIVHKSIFGNADARPLRSVVEESVREFSELYAQTPHLDDLLTLVNKAVALSENGKNDADNIRQLGEGWVAEETLAIAVYAVLRYPDDFSAALVAAVNHNGDSDSTGAVAGNILGAFLSDAGIGDEWKEQLELYDLLAETAARFGA